MKRSIHHSAFVLITILSKNYSDDGLAGESCALYVKNSHSFYFRFPSSLSDVTSTEMTEHILDCTQIGRSFGHLNDNAPNVGMAKDDFGFLSPCGPGHGMVRGPGRTLWTMTKHKAQNLAPTNF